MPKREQPGEAILAAPEQPAKLPQPPQVPDEDDLTPTERVLSAYQRKADYAFRLRVAGVSWPRICELAGYSDVSNANKAVRRWCGTLPRQDRVDLRELWRSRLEALWLQSTKDVAQQKPGAIVAAVRVAQMAARLDGLDEPVQIHTTVSESFQAVILELRKEELA
jgi:AraC-like DNA-binding protein